MIDAYTTSKARYREIACLVDDASAAAVVVGAAPSATVARQTPILEQAIATFIP